MDISAYSNWIKETFGISREEAEKQEPSLLNDESLLMIGRTFAVLIELLDKWQERAMKAEEALAAIRAYDGDKNERG